MCQKHDKWTWRATNTSNNNYFDDNNNNDDDDDDGGGGSGNDDDDDNNNNNSNNEAKYTEPLADKRPFCDPKGFQPLHVSTKEIKKALQTFPLGSTGGPDGLTPQHLKDLLAEAPENKLLDLMIQLINFVLLGSFPIAINEIIFGGRLIAFEKKDGGVRPTPLDTWLED